MSEVRRVLPVVCVCVCVPGGPKKRLELSHGVMQQSRLSESAEKHVCNERTSSNMSMNFHLKRFSISRDTREIVLHAIKQCLQAFCQHRNWFLKLMVSAGVSWNRKTEIFSLTLKRLTSTRTRTHARTHDRQNTLYFTQRILNSFCTVNWTTRVVWSRDSSRLMIRARQSADRQP